MERVRQKARGGELWLSVVPAGQMVFRDVELARYPDGNGLFVGVQNVHARICEGFTNRHGISALDGKSQGHSVRAGEHGALGRTVPVDDSG